MVELLLVLDGVRGIMVSNLGCPSVPYASYNNIPAPPTNYHNNLPAFTQDPDGSR